MGRDVKNFIMIDSKSKDSKSIVEGYLKDIFSNDEYMLYGDTLSDISTFDFLDRLKKSLLGDNYCLIEDSIILCYIGSRKCDLEESFSKYITPFLGGLGLCKLFLIDGESNYEISEVDFKSGTYYNYSEYDIPDYDFSESMRGKFILKRCGISLD